MLTPLPLKVVSPELCIFNSPFEPLKKLLESPKKNVGTFTSKPEPLILPTVKRTSEPVICPLSFNFNISPTDTVPSEQLSIHLHYHLVKINQTNHTLVSTENSDDDINNSDLPAPLIKKLSDDKAPCPIENPPISPASAVIVSAIFTLPVSI